jgi:hypothetical protein
MPHPPNILTEGARRVWRYQRVLWWFFIVNLILAAFGAIPMATRVGVVADHSLHSQSLYQGFDLTAFFELAGNPEVGMWSKFSGSILFALIFFVFALFLTGGILEAYRTPRRLPASEFFQACGTYFWRWVRLLIFLLIVLAPIAILASGVDKWAETLSSNSPSEKLGFWVEFGGLLFVLFLAMSVRLWFDMAQVRAVAEQETAMRRTVVRAFKLTLRHFGPLFWIYFRISLLAWLGLALALWLWVRIPPQDVGVTFLLFELTLTWWTGIRLWQRASETVWYERWMEAHPAPPPPVSFPDISPIAELVTPPV